MTKVSRVPVDSRHMGWFINNLWNAFTLTRNKQEVRRLLKDLLTHTEVKMLAKRLQVAKMLLEGHRYTTIKQYVKVTDPTISKVSNKLEENGDGLKATVDELLNFERQIKKRYEYSDLRNKYPGFSMLDEALSSIENKIKAHKKSKSILH